jgi:triphosphoribosyl-dephospho-CoA synthase
MVAAMMSFPLHAGTNMQTPSSNNLDHKLVRAIFNACFVEVLARKPGNVHLGASFADLTWQDFYNCGFVAACRLPSARRIGVGRAILESVGECRKVSKSNANLGILLLIAPLVAVPANRELADGIDAVLDDLTVDDSKQIYEAIRIANPGGLGDADAEDVAREPSLPFREIMRLAADRDLIASQYANGFPIVLNEALPFLSARSDDFAVNWDEILIHLQLTLMAAHPDTLIARKCGSALAEESALRARRLLEAGWPTAPDAANMLCEFDQWMRADGNRRNPGTTADLIAASLFAAFRDPARIPYPIIGPAPLT